MIPTSIFICQLSQSKQNIIKAQVSSYLTSQGYTSHERKEIIENVMSDRLVLLEDYIDIKQFLN
jgi:hypothetical protein